MLYLTLVAKWSRIITASLIARRHCRRIKCLSFNLQLELFVLLLVFIPPSRISSIQCCWILSLGQSLTNYRSIAKRICHSYITNAPKGMCLACKTFEESYLTTLNITFSRFFKNIGQKSGSKWPRSSMWHSATQKCIYTPNFGFLPETKHKYVPGLTYQELKPEVYVTCTPKQKLTHCGSKVCLQTVPNFGVLCNII